MSSLAAGRLSDRDQALLNRLLADPTALPMAFKGWLPAFIEGSDIDLPMNAVHGLTRALKAPVAFSRLPIGTVLLYGGGGAPEGTRALDGSILQRGEHPELFALLADNPDIDVLDADGLRLPSHAAPFGLTYIIVA